MVETLKTKILNTLITSLNVKKEDIDQALVLQKANGISFQDALFQKGIIKEEDLLLLLVKELHIPFIHLTKYRIDRKLQSVVPEQAARQYHIIPISKLENTLTVALADPFNIFAIDDLKNITGCDIDVVMSTDSDILRAIDTFYGNKMSASVKDISKDISADDLKIIVGEQDTAATEVSMDDGEQAPIIRIVNLVIKEGLKQRASDIHLEPMAESLRVRFRIDGVLQDVMSVPKENQNAVAVRIKIMARLDITATRTPQDGRFKMRMANQEVDFRVSLLPTTFGQKVVLRILDKRNLGVGLDGLGFSERSVKLLKEAIVAPFGMVLVTGPTGSGKTTTLYSIVNALNTVDKNIITVEDPVEYLVDGMTQIQIHPEIGLNFATGLKSILRQSPDIVMVGEIRDTEAADIAIKASLTGQLVFSTLHTNDAPGALTRLVDMGVEPFLVASSLVLVCAQRLCRKICTRCREEVVVPPEVFARLKYTVKPGTMLFQGKGCNFCRYTGYHGRMGVTEVLVVDDQIREMLIKGVSSDEIKEYARADRGMVLLWDDAMQKCLAGLTTLEEVLRITTGD